MFPGCPCISRITAFFKDALMSVICSLGYNFIGSQRVLPLWPLGSLELAWLPDYPQLWLENPLHFQIS